MKILVFTFTVFYRTFLWYFTGKTIGKALMGLKVVPLNGGRLPLWRSFLRYFGYYVSGIFLGIGFFWIIFDNRRMGWHDMLARTCVVYTWEAQPDERFLKDAISSIRAKRRAINEPNSHRSSPKEEI